MCLYPRLIKNPKYRATKKNGGVIPAVSDQRVLYVPIGCGMCMECMKQKANWWRIRIMEDVKENTNGKFVTLTFSNESYKKLTEEVEKKGYKGYELDNQVAILATRRFLERWRKKYKKSVRHWLVTELGGKGTENIHLHGILWVDDLNEVEKIWSYGWIWKGKKQGGKIVNYVSERTANYITKYMIKVDATHKHYKPKVLCSPGIGGGYTKTHNFALNKYNGEETKTTYTTKTGHEMAMPIYWRNKAYNEEEREKLWIKMLDKNVRYVGGEKVRADDDEGYKKLIEYHRKRNNELGYANPMNYNQKEYEEKRRKILQDKRRNDAQE